MDLGTYIEKSVFKILQPARSRRDAPGAVGGTAFWVTPDGYALTCYHVVAVQGMDPNAIDIEYDGAPLRARLVDDYSNSARDIAVLRLNGDRPLKLPCVRLGPAGTLPWAGRAVWLFGYREGFPSGYIVYGTLRRGQDVSGIGRIHNLETRLPDGSTIGGMSGAPVVDPEQRLVVGIQHGEELAGPAISYVHPIEKVYDAWPDLLATNATATAEVDAFMPSLDDESPYELSEDERQRRASLRGDDLKYYFYLSESKINMLYDQLVGTDSAATKYQRLSTVLERLEERGAIGTIEKPGPYFAGELDMRWEAITDDVVFFLGETGESMIGLGGSPTHLLGRARRSPIGSSAVVTEAALNHFLRQLRQAGEAIEPEDRESKSWKSLLTRTSQSSLFRSGLRSENLEFVSKTLVKQEHVLLGTPLYVAVP